jgi:Flp pilus assembly protein TadB
LFVILFIFGTLFATGAYFILADLLKVPTLASTKAVLSVASHSKQSKSVDAIIFDLAAKLSKLIHIDDYDRRKMLAALKSADIKLTPETYIAKAWVKSGLIGCLIIPLLLIFPLLAPVILFLAIAVYFKERRQADEIITKKREEIEYELPRFVSTIAQELKSSRDVLNILKSYQKNAGEVMKKELEITIADMASGNEETALTRFESRIGSTMLSDVIRGLISAKRGDNGIVYFEMLSMTFKQLELQRLKLMAMKQPGKMRKYSFFLLGCFLLMYLGVLGYEVMGAFSKMF